MTADRAAQLAEKVKVMEQLLGSRVILQLADDPQAVLVMALPTQELVLAVLDREGDRAAVTLTAAGVEKLRDALTGWLPPEEEHSSRGLPAARFQVLAKRPGHVPTVATKRLTEEHARAELDRLFSSPQVRSVQYALAELQLVEQYR